MTAIKQANEFNYYASQLNRLNKEGDLKVKFYDESGNTNVFNLNAESLPIVIEFLQSIVRV